ncbi:pyridoxal-phosphate dependent enzyme [Candidatus Bathyarchaeota archaeon]|nr:pyridoxal-phosphate dependent enzyme [Candidatus Bathyarchaeota archaeon]
MSLMGFEIKCLKCGHSSSNSLLPMCPLCGGPLDVTINVDFETEKIRTKEMTVWRYACFFPYVRDSEILTLGEGCTPLVKSSNSVYFKLDNLNPTGSFKDRGSAVLLSALQSSLKEVGGCISEDSSGNAGASMAAYAARAGLSARIYVPEDASGPKLNQIRFYGAEVVKVSGSRSKVAEEAQKAEEGKSYVGHILHPMFRDGIRSLAYEIAERFDWNVPEHLFLPVSAGTSLLGVLSGFKHLVDSNIIDDMPRVVACQTHQVSPLYHRFKNLSYYSPEKVTSIADALVSVNPPLLDLMVSRLKEAKGDTAIVEENEVYDAFIELARKGFFVEPSSAVAYAAYNKQLENKEVSRNDQTVIVLTGAGLKTTLTSC